MTYTGSIVGTITGYIVMILFSLSITCYIFGFYVRYFVTKSSAKEHTFHITLIKHSYKKDTYLGYKFQDSIKITIYTLALNITFRIFSLSNKFF